MEVKLLNAFFSFVFVVGVLASCKKDDKFSIALDETKMTSFGFYAEDNPGVILQDYVVTNINNRSINVAIPADIDKSKLVARYTVSDGIKVKVNAAEQLSGKTFNDFTVPVDYILMGENNNARYTVTITKAEPFIWKIIPVAYEDSISSMVMKVNTVTNFPYVLYKEYRKTSADQKAAVAVFSNDVWKSAGEVSDGQIGTYYDITFNNAGTPYVSYADYTASVSQAPSVKKLNQNGTWELVGNKGFSGKISFNTLTFNNSKLLMLSAFDGTAGPLTRRELNVSIFDNSAWTTHMTIPGRSSDQVVYFPTVVTKNGVTYLAIFNAINPNSLSLYKYENNAWTILLDKWKDANSTAMTVRDFDMDADNNGNVYIAFADNSKDAVLKHRVIKYNTTTKTVTSIGNYLPGASGGLFNFEIAISPLGTPYLFYKNESNYPTIVYLDKETQDWTTPYIFESQAVDELNLSFATNGEAYVAYLKNRKLYSYKYSSK